MNPRFVMSGSGVRVPLAAPSLLQSKVGQDGNGAHSRAIRDCSHAVAVMFAALGVWGTATAWPDLIVAAIMAGIFLTSAFQILRRARVSPDDATLPES